MLNRTPRLAEEMPAAVAKLFFALWLLNHILYPLWFPLSGGVKSAVGLFLVLCAVGTGIFFWLRDSLTRQGTPIEADGSPVADLLTLPKDAFLWGLVVLIAAIRVYPLTLPIHIADGGDEGVHMGVPALPFKMLARHLPFPYPPAIWIFLGIAFYYRGNIFQIARRSSAALLELRPLAVGGAAALAAAYSAGMFLVIRYFLRSGHPTFAADILRFPPLCKWVRIPFYMSLGVSNFAGRLPEFLFFIATGFLLYKLLLEFRSKSMARLAAAVFWFLPPFAYFGIRGSQTEGEAFFYVLTCYFCARWALRGQRSALYWACLAVATGSMYRYTVPLLAMVLAIFTALAWRADDKVFPRPSLRTLVECATLMTLMIAPWMISYSWYKMRPYTPLQQYSALGKLAVPFWTLPRAVSWPIAAIMVSGFLLALFRKKDFLQKYLLIWFGAYYLFIGLDQGEVIRLNLPMYLPLIIWTVEAISIIIKNERWVKRLGLALLGYLFLISTLIPVSPMEPRYTLFHSLKTEYLPLTAAAKELDRMPEGTRLLAIDCSPGCFTIDLPRPRIVQWTVVDSDTIASLDDLRKIALDNKIDVVMYTAATIEAMGTVENSKKNFKLLREFERSSDWLSPRKEYALGENKIIFKNVAISQ